MASSVIQFILGLPLFIFVVHMVNMVNMVNIVLSIAGEWSDACVKLVSSVLDIPHSNSNLDKLRKFFKTSKNNVTEGEKLFDIPVHQRCDGTTIKLGAFVKRKDDESTSKINSFNVKRIAVRADLSKTVVILVPAECGPGHKKQKPANNNLVVEEITIDVNDVTPMKDKGVCPDIARNGMEIVSRSSVNYSYHIQKFVRKHQLSSAMRKQVQTFLEGFSMTGTCSLGCVNWQTDPAILGLERDTDFSLDYRVERRMDKETNMDLLLGDHWDVWSCVGTDAYRIILTMELVVDSHQELFLKMDGTLITGKLDSTGDYRANCFKDSSHMFSAKRLLDITNNRTRRLSINNASGAHITPGQTLAWDEFQTQSAGNSPWRGQCGTSGGVHSAAMSVEELFTSGTSLPTFPASSTPNPPPSIKIVFNSPIKEVSGEDSGLSTGTGPNTSTGGPDQTEDGDCGQESPPPPGHLALLC